MQRKDLVKKIAEKANVKQSEAERMFNSFVDVVTEAFNDDEKIEIRGFGNFIKKTRKARVARNIAANTTVNVPEKDVLVFKVSPLFNSKK